MEPEAPQKQQGKIPIYRFLVIGRMGDGKSSLCRYLTGVQHIQVSSKVASCTRQCKLYQSLDPLNQSRGYGIQVLDTPGLDSNHENMLKLAMQMADIFNKCEQIHGILYVVSMSHNRDQTISWFLNFLRLYFKKQQLSKAIIPILTHYDKILFQDDQKIQQMKNSRKQAIVRFWGEGEDQKQIINFWENFIEWINDANQKAGLKENPDFKDIYYNQLNRLISKAKTINLPLAQNAKEFEDNLLERMSSAIKKSDKKYDVVKQQIPPFKFKVNLTDLSFWKTLKQLKSNFSKFVIGTFVIFVAKGYAHKKYKTYEKSMIQVNVGLFEEVKIGISKIMHAKFCMQFFEWITVSTSSKDTVQDLNRVFSTGGMCHIHIALPKDTYFGIQSLKLQRLVPQSHEPCALTQKTQNNKLIFQDYRRVRKQTQRQYQFKDIVILRPCDQFLNEILTNIIKDK